MQVLRILPALHLKVQTLPGSVKMRSNSQSLPPFAGVPIGAHSGAPVVNSGIFVNINKQNFMK